MRRIIVKPFDEISLNTKYAEYVDEGKLSVEEWLELIEEGDPSKAYTNVRFPTQEIEDEYFNTIHNRTTKEVKRLLTHLLISSTTLGYSDKLAFEMIESARP